MLPRASQLDSFTDVFRDDFALENISQPLSLSSSADTIIESPAKVFASNFTNTSRPVKGTGQHGEFRSVEEIDPKYRCLFTFPYFNLVQSRVIEDALYSDKSMVLCAPTGSGKTVAFEMAILRLLTEIEDSQYTGDFKIIYMAPVKAVCNERLTEWYPKLTRLGLLCVEVTGDTEVDFGQLKPYKVIITTPEKWDMLTRRWRDHRGLVEMIKLFLIDEVHILNDETRGPVLETVVSRMKTIESAAQSAHRIELLQRQRQGCEESWPPAPRIRFVAVSATVSNPEDVAHWLGTSEKPAVFYKFGDECRPVRLRQIVEGYPCAEGTSIFKFDIILNYKLWSIIQRYYNGKPTLIFCNTRKSVALTAETLSREITVSFNPEQKAKLTALASTLKNKKLQMLAMSGVGCHHAGLLYEERVNIERAFRNRDLPILITTTTLAMGVNLPAHLVIIKNTQQYVNGAYQEYSISTVLQMVGRAGRPQFDTEATAVIMTRLNDKARYQSLVGGSEPLQSYLHKRIAENLNSEAALGTVTDVAQCVEWLRSTFLYVRAAKDPKRYLGLPPAAPTHLILKKIEELCVKAMNGLASAGLITMDEASCIESTEAGRLMSVFYLDVETMKNIMKIDGTENLERLLWLICESHELSEMHLRMDERRCLNLLNRNKEAATIRFPMKGKISTRQMKMNCIIQAVLGCLHIPEPALNQEAMKVMKIAGRVCRCLVRYMSRPELVCQQPQPQCFSAVLNSIVLAKCIEAHLWENSPYVSKQLKGIGPTFSTLLASAGNTSFMLLEESHPRDLERIMNRGPPAGNVLRKQVSLLPKYQLTATQIDSKKICVQLMLLNHGQLSENMDQLTAGDSHKSYLIVGDTDNNLLMLTPFTDRDLISVYDGTMKFEITRKQNNEHKMMIHCISSNIAGIDVQTEFTFLDLEPPAPRESDYFNSPNQNLLPTKQIASRQTNITDVYKERKRKANSELDITQCKEKKKRENALTEKLKALKESFGKTSKELKKDINQSAEKSSKLLNDLLENNGHTNSRQPMQNIQDTTVQCPIVDLSDDHTYEPLEEIVINDDNDDYIDDLEIDNILSKIESEISGNAQTSNEYGHSNEKKLNSNRYMTPVAQTVEKKKNMNTTTKVFNEPTCREFVKDSTKRKNIQAKSNFSFIDLIEKKTNSDDTDEVVFNGSDHGFSDTIKSQISNFLQRTHLTKLPSPGINERLYNIDHTALPTVHVKRNSNTETSLNKQKIDQNFNSRPDKADNETETDIEITKNVEHELVNKISDTELPAVYVKKSIPASETSISINGHSIGKDDLAAASADNAENITETCNQVETLMDTNTTVQVEDNSEYNNLHAEESKSSENQTYGLIKDTDKTMSETNQVLTMENIVMPSHKFNVLENKVDQLDTSSNKSLIPYPCKLEKTQDEIEYADAFHTGSVAPVRSIAIQSNKVIQFKPPAISSNPVAKMSTLTLNYDNNLTLNISKNKVEQIDIAAKKSMTSYQIQPKTIQFTNGDAKTRLVPDTSIVIQSNNVSRINPSIENNNPVVNIEKQNIPSYAARPLYQNASRRPELVNQQPTACSDNTKETHVNRYCYTATKIDVCTKNNADHQLRITRKLKVDVDITESVTKEKIELNRMNTHNKDLVRNTRRDEVESLAENKKKLIWEREVENCTQSLDESHANEVIGESDNPKIDDKKKEGLCNKEVKPKHCTANNSIGNILQKYSKILSKTETHKPPIITRINENKDGISATTAKTNLPKTSIAKPKRPFRIMDIHTMDVPTKTIIETVVTKTPPNAFLERKNHEIKKTAEIKSPNKIEAQNDLDFHIHDSEINVPSPIESPISVLSLELDPTENIKDESMFDPKAVLQYFSTDSKDTEIIAPPAEFCDASAYSPTMPTQHLSEFYENYACGSSQHSIREDEESLDNVSNVHSSPKKVETWSLSREEDQYYATQPMYSAPWIISQRNSNSQLNAGSNPSRTTLGQFKFVRKKPLRVRPR